MSNLFTKIGALFEDDGLEEDVKKSQDGAARVQADADNEVSAATTTDNITLEDCACSEGENNTPTSLFEEEDDESCGCAAPKKKPKGADKKNNSTKTAKADKPKEPEHDLERLVVITAQNEQRTYPPELSLEEIRQDLERDFPAFSKENTSWHFEKQGDKERYLCIPTYKFSKAG